MLLRAFASSLFAVSVATSGFSGVADIDYNKFKTLDGEYDKRGDWAENNDTNRKAFLALIGEYDKMIKNEKLSGDNLFYAVGQANRLAYYYGDLVLGTTESDDHKRRQEVFGECVDRTELINPSKMSAPFNTDVYQNQYYHWYMSCLALKVEFANLLEKTAASLKFKDIINKKLGIKVENGNVSHNAGNVCYEMGGIFRTLAGIYTNSKAKVVGLYDLDYAIAYADAAISQSANAEAYCELSGSDDFSNYVYKAEALSYKAAETGDASLNAQAKTVLENGIFCRYLTDATGNCSIGGSLDEEALMEGVEDDEVLELSLAEALADMQTAIDLYNSL